VDRLVVVGRVGRAHECPQPLRNLSAAVARRVLIAKRRRQCRRTSDSEMPSAAAALTSCTESCTSSSRRWSLTESECRERLAALDNRVRDTRGLESRSPETADALKAFASVREALVEQLERRTVNGENRASELERMTKALADRRKRQQRKGK